MVGSCTFTERWQSDDREHPKDKHKAICKLCNKKDFSIEKMGVSALVSHMNGKNHSSIVKSTNPFNHCFSSLSPNLNPILNL